MIKFSGSKSLIKSPESNENVPKIRHNKFYLKLSSTVFKDFPPYLTIVNWITIVPTMMIKKSGLFKKFSNTLTSLCLSFLALISLKIWSNTNTLKKIE